MNNQLYIDINNIDFQQNDENKNNKRILKAINLIDEFVTKFISKVEYYKLTLESKINQTQLKLINTPSLIHENNKINI